MFVFHVLGGGSPRFACEFITWPLDGDDDDDDDDDDNDDDDDLILKGVRVCFPRPWGW